MPYYRSVGEVPRKRHTQFRRPDGGLYAEELMGIEGFSHDSALLYHRHLPTAIVGARAGDDQVADAARPPEPPAAAAAPADAQARPGHGRRGDRAAAAHGQRRRADPVRGRRPSRPRCTATRSATSCVYVESGAGGSRRSSARWTVGAGDYVVLPTSTTHRWVPDTASGEPLRLLVIEATGHVGPPRRYLSPRGQFLEHAPVLRARPARAGRAAAGRRRATSTCSCGTGRA